VATQGAPSKIPTLAAGEVAIFSEFGQMVILDKDGNIQVAPASGKDIVFNGRVIAKNDVISEGKLLAVGEVAAKVVKAGSSYADLTAVHLSTHTHPVSGSATTGPVPGS
jgi:phage gp45-like